MASLRALPCAVVAASIVLANRASASCLGTEVYIFRDVHDGDLKQMQRNPDDVFNFYIMPYNSTEKWTVFGEFDLDCVASVDFNVPGKPNPPPVNVTMSLWIMGSVDERLNKLGLEWTDPSGTLAPPTQPINFWVMDHWPKKEVELPPLAAQRVAKGGAAAQTDAPCIYTPRRKGLVVNDLHDGDEKLLRVTNPGNAMTITPHANQQSWVVGPTKFDDHEHCVASVDFNVPGKPNPPPVPLNARVWGMVSIKVRPDKSVLVFTDPSGTLADPSASLNVWAPSNEPEGDVSSA